MKTRDVWVGRQRIEEFERSVHADGTRDVVVRIDGDWIVYDMSFDEAVLRASAGEQMAPCLF